MLGEYSSAVKGTFRVPINLPICIEVIRRIRRKKSQDMQGLVGSGANGERLNVQNVVIVQGKDRLVEPVPSICGRGNNKSHRRRRPIDNIVRTSGNQAH